MTASHPLILDCDTGRDDAIAIWLAFALGLKLEAVVTSYGNTPLDNVIENTRHVLNQSPQAKENNLALFQGAKATPSSHILYQNLVLPRQTQSGNGLCDIALPAHDDNFIPQHLTDCPSWINDNQPVDYIITGPATNLARMIRSDRDLMKRSIRRIIMMGGKFAPLWDNLPGADFNLACDPHAIDTILRADIPMHFVPMNATWPVMLTLEEIEALEATTEIAQIAQSLMIAHCKYFAPEPVFRFHDPMVMMALLDMNNFAPAMLKIETNEASENFGRLTHDDKGHECFIYQDLDNEKRGRALNHMLEALGFKKTV